MTKPIIPTGFDVLYDEIDHECFPIFSGCQMEQYGLDCAEYTRKQALEESLNICKEVQEQVVYSNEQYSMGREMGATVCANKIKELFK